MGLLSCQTWGAKLNIVDQSSHLRIHFLTCFLLCWIMAWGYTFILSRLRYLSSVLWLAHQWRFPNLVTAVYFGLMSLATSNTGPQNPAKHTSCMCSLFAKRLWALWSRKSTIHLQILSLFFQNILSKMKHLHRRPGCWFEAYPQATSSAFESSTPACICTISIHLHWMIRCPHIVFHCNSFSIHLAHQTGLLLWFLQLCSFIQIVAKICIMLDVCLTSLNSMVSSLSHNPENGSSSVNLELHGACVIFRSIPCVSVWLTDQMSYEAWWTRYNWCPKAGIRQTGLC